MDILASSLPFKLLAVVFFAGLWAGLQNALAGGGSFITLPALIVTGMSPLAANITSTVALFPGQLTSGVSGRSLAPVRSLKIWRRRLGKARSGSVMWASRNPTRTRG